MTSFSKLQREAISTYNRIVAFGDLSVTGSKSRRFPTEDIKYIFDFSKENKQNYIGIIYSVKNPLTGYSDVIKRVDFKYTQGIKNGL